MLRNLFLFQNQHLAFRYVIITGLVDKMKATLFLFILFSSLRIALLTVLTFFLFFCFNLCPYQQKGGSGCPKKKVSAKLWTLAEEEGVGSN